MSHPVLLVAQREIRQKVRSRAFRITTVGMLAVVALATVLPGLLASDPEPTTLGVLDPARAVAEAVAASALAGVADGDPGVELVDLADEDAARDAVRSGEVDAALVTPDRILTEGERSELTERVDAARGRVALLAALEDAGVPPAEVDDVLATPPVTVERLDEEAAAVEFGPELTVGFLAIGALYGLLIFYGQMVAQGVVREKESRVIEILVSTIRPVQLLAGKLLGLGLVGFVQVVLLVVTAGIGLTLSGTFEVPSETYGTLALVGGWYVLGFALYGALYALVGALVSTSEDLQGASMPVIMLLVASLIAIQFSIEDPTGVAAQVASLVPFSAPLAQPLLVAAGAGSWTSGLLAAAITIATIAVLLPLSARIHRGGVLVTRGRIGLLEAFRNARR